MFKFLQDILIILFYYYTNVICFQNKELNSVEAWPSLGNAQISDVNIINIYHLYFKIINVFYLIFFQKKCSTQCENASPNIQSHLPKVNNTSVIAKDVQTSTREVTPARKSYQKINGHKKNEINNDSANGNEHENGTNSGHSSSNESNNIDKRKKGQYF